MREKEFLPLLQQNFGIDRLNEMQNKMMQNVTTGRDILLLSPTGSGKTIAFSLAVMKLMKPSTGRIQCVVMAPSRELVIQIATVMRKLSREFKVTALYGGHDVTDEVNSLKICPDIVVSTPGRLLDHSVRKNLELLPVRVLVIDEFDKMMELGFEEEMEKILKRLKNISKTILTSATNKDVLPDFLKLEYPLTLDFTSNEEDLNQRINIHKVQSDDKDKLKSLLVLLRQLANGSEPEKTIVFLNHRESAERIFEFLKKEKVSCGLYHGGLDQRDRETAVAVFNNGTKPILIATDLASRGLDIENIRSVIHYHLPLTEETFKHRNGRTARVEESGDIYLLVGPDEKIEQFVKIDDVLKLKDNPEGNLKASKMTLYIGAGKKEKISRGDIVGFMIKEGGLEADDLGKIDIFDHYALVAVNAKKVPSLLVSIEGKKLKGEKRRISPLK